MMAVYSAGDSAVYLVARMAGSDLKSVDQKDKLSVDEKADC
jgi:hypothetical protein